MTVRLTAPQCYARLLRLLRFGLIMLTIQANAFAEEPNQSGWKYEPELLRPFWEGDTVEGETLLFIKDEATGAASAATMFPIQKILAVRNSAGDVTFKEGQDYIWNPDSREIVLPAQSSIVSRTAQELRRPAGSQPHRLTHRDGNGEILFGARLEYADMQTSITYQHAPNLWKSAIPEYDPTALPRSVDKLRNAQPLSIVVLGDSISAGHNSSKLGDSAPFQPAYPELVALFLEARFGAQVELTNLSVSGTDTNWGVTQVGNVVQTRPDLVILAFGMNDSAGRSAKDYQANIHKMIDLIRETLPESEFVLVASMLGNRDWTSLRHELFPQYRDVLAELCESGIALADVTSIWTRILELKNDWDQTGNGVNHPNDFGHRVYAQVITTLLDRSATLHEHQPEKE